MRAALVIAALSLGASFGSAPWSRAEAASARPVVRITIAGDDASVAALEAVLRELLARLEVEPIVAHAAAIDPASVVAPEASPPAAVARIWIDLHAGALARVFLADAAWERILVRNVPLPDGPSEVAREQIAHIVEGAVEALLAGGEIGVTREEARVVLGVPAAPPPENKKTEPAAVVRPRSVPARTPPIVPEGRLGLAASLGYEALSWGSGVLSHGLAVFAETRRGPGPWVPFVALGGIARVPMIAERDPIGVRIDAGAVRLLAGVDRALSSATSLRFALGGGVDVLRVEPRAGGVQGIELEAARTIVSPIVRAGLGLSARISPSATFSVSFLTDVDLGHRSFVILNEGREEPLLTPYRIRPGVALGLVSDVL